MLSKIKRGFTLIELLVVVLIIAILAAVALPQYQKAVEKSRATHALALLRTAYEQAAFYYMQHGTYPNTFDEMDLDIPWPVATSASLRWANLGHEKQTLSDGTWSLQIYHAGDGSLIVFIGLVKGKYAGGGFEVRVVQTDGKTLLPGTIRCVERSYGGTVFGGDPGDYCTKVMNATLIPGYAATTYRGYEMP